VEGISVKWQRLLMALVVLLLGVLVAPLPAQGKADQPAAKPHDRVDAMAARLGLSDGQKEQVRKIIAEYDPKADEVEHQMWALHHDEREAMSKVLTDSQRAKVPEILKEEREKELDKVAGELGLSDEQKEKVKKIHAEYHQKFHQLAEKGGAAPGAYRHLRHEEFAAIGHELNDAQRAKLPGIIREEFHQWHDAAALERHLKAIADKLDLSAEQRDQVKKVLAEYQPKMEKLVAQLHQVHHDEHEAISKVLTDEQRAKLNEHRRSRTAGTEDAPKKN
jgi:Spy/CpxP family protein refolding chaperone